MMRTAKIMDGWRRVNDVSRFKTKINSFTIKNLPGFDDIVLDTHSAITSICGKNGVGKTTLLKAISRALSFKTDGDSKRYDNFTFDASLTYKSENIDVIDSKALELENIYYLEPSRECLKIIEHLQTTSNVDEYIENAEANEKFNSLDIKLNIEGIIGKKYKNITLFEIDNNSLADDYTFPIFVVESFDGITYSNCEMGMGEFAIFYIIWYLDFCENDSILFIEELENFISAYSQKHLLDYLVHTISNKGIWVILSTHSEHVLFKLEIENTRILSNLNGGKTKIIKPSHEEKYLRALGLKVSKKGMILVEDFFAKSLLFCILNKFSPILLKEYEIISLRCDSNLEKLIKHYEPDEISLYSIATVFDADQSKKVQQYFNNRAIYVTALPSNEDKPPEYDFIKSLFDGVKYISEHLEMDIERLEDVIASYDLLNYHDILPEISKDLEINLDILIKSIFSYMLTDKNFSSKAEFFSYILGLREKYLPYTSNTDEAGNISIEVNGIPDNIVEYFNVSYTPMNDSIPLERGNIKIGFNGIKPLVEFIL